MLRDRANSPDGVRSKTASAKDDELRLMLVSVFRNGRGDIATTHGDAANSDTCPAPCILTQLTQLILERLRWHTLSI
ncbi:MAG TPA: hypothetical protein VFK26_12570, partial [Gemmatimonadaceae bacterium]|nr:hypothetical protein [Gemmatimonadaceae bacterium]